MFELPNDSISPCSAMDARVLLRRDGASRDFSARELVNVFREFNYRPDRQQGVMRS